MSTVQYSAGDPREPIAADIERQYRDHPRGVNVMITLEGPAAAIAAAIRALPGPASLVMLEVDVSAALSSPRPRPRLGTPVTCAASRGRHPCVPSCVHPMPL